MLPKVSRFNNVTVTGLVFVALVVLSRLCVGQVTQERREHRSNPQQTRPKSVVVDADATPSSVVNVRGLPGSIPNAQLLSLSKPPYQFLGWKYASQRGGDYLGRFARRRANTLTPIATSGASNVASSMFAATPLNASSTSPSIPGFLFRQSFPANFIPSSVAVGDFNGDGNMDWVVANAGSNDLWLYLGKGNGTASLPIIIPLQGQSPSSVVAADLRKRGILDLIVAEPDTGTVEVLLGNGDGTFGTGSLYGTPAPPLTVAVADFDGDGNPDVLVGMFEARTIGSLAILPGDGTGHLGAPKFAPDNNPADAFIVASVSVADLNGDGHPDVVLVDQLNTQLLSFLNSGDGTFTLAQLVMGTTAPGQFLLNSAVGDLNGDGCPDAVVTDTFADAYIFLGNCDGTFQRNFAANQFNEYGVGDNALEVTLADVNGDGKLDLITTGFVLDEFEPGIGQFGGNIISVLFGDGSGNFSSPHLYRGEPDMVGVAVTDMNKDGFPDLITANQDSDSTSVFLNDGKGGFGTDIGSYVGWINGGAAQGGINAPVSNFIPIDLNGDGKLDLAFLEYGQLSPDPFQLSVLINKGNGAFAPVARYPVTNPGTVLPLSDFKFGDFRNTGHPDFVGVGITSPGGPSFISFTPNNGNGTFGAATVVNSPFGEGLLGVGDFNGDGRLDFIVVNQACQGATFCLTTFLGNGDGTFRQGASLPFNTSATGSPFPGLLYVGDFNRDGKLDLLFWPNSGLNTSVSDLYEFLGNGNGTFQQPIDILQNFEPFAVADLNHDGIPDIVEAVPPTSIFQTGSTAFAIYMGQGDGTFSLTNNYAPYDGVFGDYLFGLGILTNRYSPMVADFNGDGNLDIAAFQLIPGQNQTTSIQQAYLQILLGNGDGTFTPSHNQIRFHKSAVPNNVADVNGDGRADLIELDQYSSSFDVMPAVNGPGFQMGMQALPVVGNQGQLTVNLSLPSSSGTTISLSSSDPAISVPAAITIPAGTISQSVVVQIGPAFNPSHVFSIQGQLGAEIETAYGFQVGPNSGYGFTLSDANPTEGVLPGQTSLDYVVGINSVAGYQSTLQLSCSGLPPGFTCQFGQDPFPLTAGYGAITSLLVASPASAAVGSYPFTIVAKDNSLVQRVPATLNVGDFQIQLQPSSMPALPGDTLAYNLPVASINGYNQGINLACSNVPPGIVCLITSPSPTLSAGLISNDTALITVPSTSVQGTYTFNVVGTAVQTSHAVVGQFTVGGITGSIAPSAATISVGTEGMFSFTLNSQNGYTGRVTLQCAPSGNYFCTSDVVTLPPNGSATGQLTISMTSKPPRSLLTARLGNQGNDRNGRAVSPLLLMTTLCMGLCFCSDDGDRKRRWRCLLFGGMLMLLAIASVSCGGGGTGGNSGGGGAPTTIQIAVTAQSQPAGGSSPVGTLSVTVP